MKDNGPVSNNEYVLAAQDTLMSTTDPSSHIRYANDAFVDASGFTRDELTEKPHNVVRHPDMPAEAFADMWATLKNGLPWTGLVKNRRKNGDFYWVRANAAPVVRQGRIVGHLSVRTKPTKAEISHAETLYRRMREGHAQHLRLHKGVVLRKGLGGIFSRMQALASVRWRMAAPSLVVMPVLVVAASALGLTGWSIAAFTAITGLCFLASWLWLEVQIARPISNLHDQCLNVATGANRDAKVAARVDEIGMSVRAVNQMGMMLRWLGDDIYAQAQGLQGATDKIATGNLDLSTRTEKAAASVEQTAASMAEVSAGVQNSVKTAQQANEVSDITRQAAERGGKAMADVTQMMNEIATSARRIADIIGTIDSIAFQTNILALNASVEAARAGEQGRGFAVVAGEVRALAQRSASAAREIRTLIGASVEKVDSGTQVVGQAGQTIDEVIDQVRRVSTLISEISAASNVQSDNISQVRQAVSHFDQITQQNAALVEESAAASSSLQHQASLLVEAVNVFR